MLFMEMVGAILHVLRLHTLYFAIESNNSLIIVFGNLIDCIINFTPCEVLPFSH
jgi:large-conductance mechanosensitive channel